MRTTLYVFKKAVGLSLFAMWLSPVTQAQNVGINTTGAAGHPSALLDVSATDKGVLFPNVTLTGAGDGTTISSPAKGLMVWNTGSSWGTAALYYNDGTTGSPDWVKVSTALSDLTPGAGLTGTTVYNGSSAQTFSVASGNGLSTDAGQDRVKLGGTLDENTAIAKGNFGLTLNQTGTGDFDIQDNGSSSLFVFGNDGAGTDGNVGIGTNSPAFRLSVNGTLEAIDFGPAGSQNIRIGDDTYLTDVDIAHTLGLYSSSATGEGRLVLGAVTEMLMRSTDQTGNFGSAGNFDFDDATAAAGIVLESGTEESGGFFANGNTTAIWSPGDGTGGILSIYDEDAMALSTPAVRVEGDGDLKMYGDNSIHMANNVAYVINRTEQSFANTNTTYVNVTGTTTALQVDANDIVVVNVSLKFKFTGGSGNDDVRFRLNVTGCTSTTQADTYESENFDNDRDEYQPVSMQYVVAAPCSGTLQFSIQMDAFSDADDAAKVGDLVITATKY